MADVNVSHASKKKIGPRIKAGASPGIPGSETPNAEERRVT